MKKKPQGHYCRICGERKANEKFTGKGHAAHICNACAKKSPEQKSEDLTMNKLHGMMFRYLSESEMKWLKKRCNDIRLEVSELAKQVFDTRFPRQVRNEVKGQLNIKNVVFHIHNEVWTADGVL